jgi:hypothetical protein
MKNTTLTVSKTGVLFALLLALGLSTSKLEAQEKSFDFGVTLNSDTFFGFYPTFQGSYGDPEKVLLTFYGIHWGGGTGAAWGNWTEFGIGASFSAGDYLTINPQLGIVSGSLLSSGALEPSIFGDGIVPNLTANLASDLLEGQLYFGLYAPLQDKAPMEGTTLAYIHYWLNTGIKASDVVSIGAHFEHLINSGGSKVETSTDVYQWIGPYIQFTHPNGGPFARFTFGTDMVDGAESFFKLTTGFSF